MFVRKTAVLILFFCLISGLVFWQREASADTYVRVDRPELNGAVLLVADLMDIGEPQVILGRQNAVYIVHEDEGRYFRKEENLIHFYEELGRFFDEHLKK